MIPAGVKIFRASHPIDFRKGPESFLSLVHDAGSDPFNGSLYVFRAKVELDRKLMAKSMCKLGFNLDILADYFLAEIKKAERIFADETILPTLAPGSGSAKMSWL